MVLCLLDAVAFTWSCNLLSVRKYILFIVFLLGFLLDWIEITLIILPLLSPIVDSLGFEIEGFGAMDEPDLIWFTLLVAVALQTSFLTPPVGFALFYLKGVCPPEIKMADIYKGVAPFIILQLIGLTLVVLFPALVTWLPSVAYWSESINERKLTTTVLHSMISSQ